MAINENVLGQVRPSESAVDRLRKRNRIRPWESGLVGAQPDPKSQADGLVKAPPGSVAQGAGKPVGILPPGSDAPDVKHIPDNLPRGFASSEVNCPVEVEFDRACANVSKDRQEAPTGHEAQRSRSSVGILPPGSLAQGIVPSGQKAPEEMSPLGELQKNTDTRSKVSTEETQRAADPVGSQPTGYGAPGLRLHPVSGFDPAPFVPEEKGVIAWREKGSGELRIPHRLYEFAHRVTSTRNELLVFDCLLRFSLGFHRSWCEAGYSFIAAWTGISDITNIKKSLRTLLAAGIVVKTKEHDSASNSGSIYELPVVKGYLEYLANAREPQPAKQPVGSSTSGHAAPGDAASSASRREASRPLGVLPPKKENLNQISKKSLSQENSEIDAYVDGIKPAAKRESEMHFLGTLLSEYSLQDVLLALNYVRRFGALGSKAECHSPLKYLSSAIEQVLPKAREWTVLLCRVEADETSGGNVREENPSADEKWRAFAVETFQSELPQSEQDRLLSEATAENSVMGYAPPIKVLRSLAAIKWFKTRTTNGTV